MVPEFFYSIRSVTIMESITSGPDEIYDAPAVEPTPPGSTVLYAVTIFISATLLFLIQPIVAKELLPWFGGAAAVWGACMVYFQALLLLGYLYAHYSIRTLSSRAQVTLHIGLLAVSVLVTLFPAPADIHPPVVAHPFWETMKALTIRIGLPYFLLSSTTPLLQSWYSRGGYGTITYRFFALSNLGSVLALMAFPLAIEPVLDLNTQLATWRVFYVVFALLCSIVSMRFYGSRMGHSCTPVPNAGPGIEWRRKLTWIALAACSSALLLGVTNSLCQNIAPMPLLWIAPLAIYLLSFVICFDYERSFHRPSFQVLLPAALVVLIAAGANSDITVRAAVPLCLASLFIVFMFCHGQVAALKPASSHLTDFYLCISVGGALGGVFVGLAAPVLFSEFFEVQMAVALCLALGLRFLFGFRSQVFLVTAAAACILFVWVFGNLPDGANTTLRARNFYGILSIRERQSSSGGTVREVVHGKVIHGGQAISESERREPKYYYGRKSGVGIVLQRPMDARRVGIVGLGAGTVAAYGTPGDSYRFYEINPLMMDLAKSQFTYIGDSRAKVELVLGDARISLEQEPANHFDVLALDAFSGDSIPVHLLTEEAFRCYFRHLKQDGILAVHISNQFLDLRPVVTEIAAKLSKNALLVQTDKEEGASILRSAWILVTADLPFLETIRAQGRGEFLRSAQRPVWTDQYSNILSVLR